MNFIKNHTELCRVFVRKTNFPFLARYSPLVEKNPKVDQEGVAGYEIVLNYNGLPFRLIPRAPSEVKGYSYVHLISVNEREQKANPCRRLVMKGPSGWQLTNNGLSLVELLTYQEY